ncbi:MAG: FRG domain-containing protein [Bacteroidales bacterium]|nr:FRG domain-containing protein [Bacteroidales bacterium]
MAKREISDLDLKIKFIKEYLENGGIEKINSIDIVEDLSKIRYDSNGKVDPDSITTGANAFMLGILSCHRMPPPYHPEFISQYSSLLQKTNNFDQINIDTFEQFDNIYDEFKDKTNTLFRGQKEAKWRLYSKLQRHWITDKLFESQNSYETLIENLVEIGKKEYETQIIDIIKTHHIDCLNSISVLGYLQHHGCPTPLLDWTYTFQNALFFGLDGLILNKTTIEIEDYFSIYYIDENHFEGGNLRIIMENGMSEIEKPMLLKLIAEIAKDEPTRKEMEEHFAGRKLFDREKILGSGLINHMTKIENIINYPVAYFSDKDINSGILFSLNNSKNILNQQGVFTWNSDSSKPLEMVGEEQFFSENDKKESNYRFCSCLNINKNLSKYIRKKLDSDQITKELIYPTVDVNTWNVFQVAEKLTQKNGSS